MISESTRGLCLPEGKLLVVTKESDIVSSQSTEGLAPCNHEEADTRLFLHCKNAYESGSRTILLTANDSDIVVLGVTFCSTYNDCYIWVVFATGKTKRCIPVHDIASTLGPSKCAGLPFLHAITGCDTVSCFHGIGKKTAWEAWNSFPQVAETFSRLSKPIGEISETDLSLLEIFVIKLYQRTLTINKVNNARAYLFSTGDRNIENIPPTQAALFQHIKRSVMQSGFTWGQYLDVVQNLPDIGMWGWFLEDGVYYPFWSALPEASAVCRELIKCGCLKGCVPSRCKCKKTAGGLACTLLCKCAGQCAS